MEYLTEFFTSIISRIIIGVILGVPIVVAMVLLARLQIKEMNKQIEGTVYFPRSWAWLIIGMSFVIFIASIGYLVTAFDVKVAIGLTIVCLIFAVVDIVFALYALNWRIYFNKDGFTYQNFFRRKFSYKYTDLTCVKIAGVGYRLYTPDKRIAVNGNCIGSDVFFNFLEYSPVKIKRSFF